MRPSAVALLLALPLAPACVDDLQGDSAATEETGEHEGSDSDGASDDPPPPVAAQCERYIACVRAAEPDEWQASLRHYGERSDCWSDGAGEAAACVDACEVGLAAMHRRYPAVKACMQCTRDNECDSFAGEFCFAGGCESVTCEGGAPCP